MTHYTVYQIRTAAEEFGIPFKLALTHRKKCLEEKRLFLLEKYHEEENPIFMHFMLQDVKKISDEINSISKELRYSESPQTTDKITDEMIAKAKDYPIEKIIEFDRAGKAIAFCHPDKTPSLSWFKKANKAHCFPCGKSFDTIGVLMERDKLTFHEAVKRLQ